MTVFAYGATISLVAGGLVLLLTERRHAMLSKDEGRDGDAHAPVVARRSRVRRAKVRVRYPPR